MGGIESRVLEVDPRFERPRDNAARGVLGGGEGLAERHAYT